jgi:uncharacterized membrane protein AbrB (regulator of aidB expression)
MLLELTVLSIASPHSCTYATRFLALKALAAEYGQHVSYLTGMQTTRIVFSVLGKVFVMDYMNGERFQIAGWCFKSNRLPRSIRIFTVYYNITWLFY